MSWLSDKLKEAEAQINMRDGGRTASTVRANRKTQPANTQKGNYYNFGTASLTNRNPNQNPGTQARVAKVKSQQSIANRARDFFDANSELDKQKRLAAGQPSMYATQQAQMGLRARNNIGEQIFAAPVRVANTAKAGFGAAYGLGNIAKESVFGTDKSYQDAVNGVGQTLQRDLNPQGGMLNYGTIFDSPEQARDISAGDLAKKSLGYGLETASFGVGAPALGKVAQTGLRQGLRQLATKQGAKNLATLSAGGAMGNGGYELGSNQNASLQSVGTAAGMGALAAPLMGVGLGAAGAGLSKGFSSISKPLRTPGLTDEMFNKRVTLMNAYTEAQQTGRKDLANGIAKQIDNIDATAKSQLSIAKEKLGLTPLNEIGAVGKNVNKLGKTAGQGENPYIIPKSNPTDVTKLSNKDLQYFAEKGHTSITDRYGNTRQLTPTTSPNAGKLNDLNPTGGVYVDYTPKARATMPLGSDMTTLAKTSKVSPNEMVTIYRGAPSSQSKIAPGDFITTNKDLAKSYSGNGNVIETKVPASHILDSKSSPLGEEYIYRPTKNKLGLTPLDQRGSVRLPGKGKQSLSDSLPNDTTAPQVGKEIKMRTIKTADGKTEHVAQLGNTLTDRVGRSTGFKATDTSPNFKTEGEMNKWIKQKTDTPAPQVGKTGNIIELQKNAERAYKQAEQLRQKYSGKPKTAAKLSQSEKAAIDKQYNALKKTYEDYYTQHGGFETGTGTLTLKDQNGVDLYKGGSQTSKPTQTTKAPAIKAQQPKVVPEQAGNQPQIRELPPQEQPLANQPTKKVSSSKAPVNTKDNTPLAPSSKEWGAMLLQADKELPSFNAVAAAKGSSSAKRLADAINSDKAITRAATEAQNTGKEINFFAKKDTNGRSVGVERFNPKQHRIEAGFVVDKDGNVLGNHIKVDDTGIQINVGGDLVNMDRVIGNPKDWGNKYRVSETMSRNIDANAPNKQVAQQTKDFVIGAKVKAEANYRTELSTEYKNLGKRIKDVQSARPKSVSKDQFKGDIFDLLDGKKTDAQIRASYDKATADSMLKYKKETRTLYDGLLKRINAERVKFGQAPIEPRKNYITHLQELNGSKSFTGEVYGAVKNSFTDEGAQRTRGGVPGQIAGRTENFQPRSAYNRFLQRRNGERAIKDPFVAVQEYLEPALYNVHMTEAAVRARAVETAFRTAGELKALQPDQVVKQANRLLEPYKSSTENGKLVSGFQEYANALSKKTQRWDRQIIDASDATAMGLKGWQKLQTVGGQATILGNVSSTLAQPLNQAIGLADAGPINWMKGITRTIGRDKTIDQSPFITARRAKAVKPIRGAGEKALDVGGIPLQKVEMASIEVIWNSQHSKAVKAGLKGNKAIQQADFNTERLVAGRGIADRPEVYRSTLTNGLLQYTLEVSAQNKAFWKDLNPGQKATFLVAAAGMNYLWKNVTGYSPLPDFLGAAVETGKEFQDPKNEKTSGEKALAGVQRVAGEYVGMNPLTSTAANIALDQSDRKKLFGSTSDVGRFEGTAAPVKVVQNAFDAGSNAIQGNWKAARDSALRTVPYGNQIRKTVTGAESIAKGYATDKGGNPTFAAPTSAAEKAQALLFGPSSTKSAQNYYNGSQRGITGAADVQSIKNSSNPAETVASIQERRAAVKNGESMSPTDQARQAFTTPLGKEMMALSDTDKKAWAQQSKENQGIYTQYSAMKKALNAKDDIIKLPSDLSDSSRAYAVSFKRKEAGFTDNGKATWYKQTPKKGTEILYNEASKLLPKDFAPLPKTNETVSNYITYLNASSRAKTNLEKSDKLKEFTRTAYKSTLSDNAKLLFSSGTYTNDQKIAALQSGDISKKDFEQAIAMDNYLYDKGLSSSLAISKTIRRKFGYSTPSSKSSSRSSGGGKISQGEYSLSKLLGTVNSSNKSLVDLLEQTLA